MKDIFLIEDHHQALNTWRRFKIKDSLLVHLDSHIDFGFYQAKPIHQIFKEANNLKDLKNQLERTLLYQRYNDDLEAQLNIGNYIYPAIRDRIASRFFWIIPGDRRKFKSCLANLKRFIKSISSQDPYRDKDLKVMDNIVSTKLYGRNFTITDIFSIQKVEKPILLDIDVDFLLFDSIKNIALTKDIGRRNPWMYPDKLARLLKEKFPKITYATIAYSVNGGFTPIEYKFFGDEIVLRLSRNSINPILERIFYLRNKAIDEYFKNELKSSQVKFEEAIRILDGLDLNNNFKARFLAHLYFWLFKISWQTSGKKDSREYYQKVIQKDPTYRIRDNNYGWLYLRKGDLKSAYAEFQKVIFCDLKDSYAICGLGDMYLRHKRYEEAQDKYRQVLRLNPKDKGALFGLASVCIQLNKLKQADKLLETLKAIEPFNAQRFILEAEVNKKKGNFKKALFFYKEVIMLGIGDIKIYEDIFKILKAKREKELISFFSQRYKTLRENFYKNQKKILLREKKFSQFERLEKTLRGTDKILASLQRDL